MAKKFCNVIGLHTIFNNNDVSIPNIKDTSIIDENSIAFITCQNDRAFGQNYVDGLKVIWAKGKIYGLGEFQTNYIGGTGIDVQDTQYEFEKFISINVNNNLNIDSNNFLNAKDTTYLAGKNIKITPVEGTQSTDNPRFTISAVDAGAPYTSGQGIQIEDNEVSHNLVAGDNVTITDNQDGTTEISASPVVYSGGNNIEITNNTISAKGYRYNESLSSFAEGARTTASGQGSHAEGAATTAQNLTEHAEGRCNLSHNNPAASYGDYRNTQHSVGIGTDTDNRKNAFEIMQNGDVYVYNIGNYQGTDIKTSTNTIQTLQDIITDLQTRIEALELQIQETNRIAYAAL